ncbi:peptidoglycan DD-metalloendopeptidase family protein [Saccharibacillus qingshengii]|uniref:peptidoglycan DD-metalloendopeptidase family protein n=1 Tax=Saccharibacillus qingshengii TaxID=1763540 RepID=UPI001556E39F
MFFNPLCLKSFSKLPFLLVFQEAIPYFHCFRGEPVPASKAGKVIFSAWQNANNHGRGYGQYIWIEHGDGYVTTYGHLSKLIAGVGDRVQAGSTGPHLHLFIFSLS